MGISTAAYQREYRRRRKANGGAPLRVPAEPPAPVVETRAPTWPAKAGAAVAAWARRRLVVPPGHPAAGAPLVLPAFAVRFFDEALRPGIREAALLCARKNGKSAVLAVLILAHLADDGPLRRRGWRCGAASLSREKAIELWMQCRDLAEAAGLDEIHAGKVPRIVKSSWGEAQFLSADGSAGHASGFDLAIADELGLFPERGRALVQGLLSSTSARDGRLIAISVIGASPLTREMIERADDPACVVHLYEAPAGCALDDAEAWRAANPALGVVKSENYMADMARRAAANPAEQSAFRAFDLNQPVAPGREMIVSLDRWQAVSENEQPARDGPVFVGFDLGGAASLTAAALYWPATGRLEAYGAAGDEPDLAARGEADGVGDRYCRMEARGEMRTWPGRVTPAAPFIKWIADILDDATPAGAAADRYRQGEVQDALAAAGAGWPIEWRAQGSGKDGSADIRAFQRAVVGGTLRPGNSLLLSSAIAESVIRTDANANPALDKSRQKGRIDALSAAVLAVGLGRRATGSNRGTTLVHFGLSGAASIVR